MGKRERQRKKWHVTEKKRYEEMETCEKQKYAMPHTHSMWAYRNISLTTFQKKKKKVSDLILVALSKWIRWLNFFHVHFSHVIFTDWCLSLSLSVINYDCRSVLIKMCFWSIQKISKFQKYLLKFNSCYMNAFCRLLLIL